MGDLNLNQILKHLNISLVNANETFKTTYEVLKELSEKWDILNINEGECLTMRNNQALEYKMSKKMFNAILNTRSEEEKKQNPKEYVASIINEQFGLKGTVTNISVYDI